MLFLPIVVCLYWRTKGSLRLALVVLASYFFYISWLPIYGVLLFALTLINWLIGSWLENAHKKAEKAKAKALLVLGLLVNLGCLCYYKYTNFFITSVLQAVEWVKSAYTVPHHCEALVVDVILPLGISFFVFEFVHYLVDVYKGDKAIKSFMEFAAFASFFPSQIAGPIKRYQDFQLKRQKPEPWSSTLFFEAVGLIIRGLFKKVAIADPIGGAIYGSFATLDPLPTADAIIAASGFVVQVYCDFSGYTDIGRGSALLMGIRLPENFNLPYLAHDIGEFWRRWHMSLSFWLRDYVYIPLGGSRVNALMHWRNLFLTMVACGLWHGASWHYVVFGCLQGIGMIVNREWKVYLRNFQRSLPSVGPMINGRLARAGGTLITMLFITGTFVVFRASDVEHAGNLFLSLANIHSSSTLIAPIVQSGIIQFLSVYFCFWLLMEYVAHNRDKLWWLKDVSPDVRLYFSTPMRLASWTAAVFLMLAAKPGQAIPFVYFQF